MRRKLFIILMIIFTVFMSATLFAAFICGAPTDSSELGRYLFGAAGLSVFLPTGFTFFLIRTFDLVKALEESEKLMEQEVEFGVIFDTIDIDAQIPAFVNALARKKKLTPEEKARLLSYLEGL